MSVESVASEDVFGIKIGVVLKAALCQWQSIFQKLSDAYARSGKQMAMVECLAHYYATAAATAAAGAAGGRASATTESQDCGDKHQENAVASSVLLHQ